jgi:hypothetical protein
MTWVVPSHSRNRVDAAGRCFVDPKATPEERELALVVINNWRSAHSFPLNTFQMYLRDRVTQIDGVPTVAQRIKRLQSIRHKLDRWPDMKLSRMQDIGGCRAVLSDAKAVDAAILAYSQSRIKHKLVRRIHYGQQPKASGYRGVHLIYRYHSDRNATWEGLQVEIQLRTQLQHAWATAVETVGLFTQQALKSSWGDADWLRFFALMSSWMALREGTALVPDTPQDPVELRRQIKQYANKLNVASRLGAFSAAVNVTSEPSRLAKPLYYVLELKYSGGGAELYIRDYSQAVEASDAYNAIEHATGGDERTDVVLVGVDQLQSLRRAYPNYYADTSSFVAAVRAAIA